MTKTAFKEQVFEPLVKECEQDLLACLDKDIIKASLFQALDNIKVELPTLNLPNAKYITFSLLRTHLLLTGEFSYLVCVFNDEFNRKVELSPICTYHAFWLTKKNDGFSKNIELQVSKSMIKHSPVFVKELKNQVVDDFNICFIRTAKNLLGDYNEDSFSGFTMLAGDYVFSTSCLRDAKVRKVREFYVK